MNKTITGELLNRLIALGMPKDLIDYETVGEDFMGSEPCANMHDVNDWLLKTHNWWVAQIVQRETLASLKGKRLSHFGEVVNLEKNIRSTACSDAMPNQYAALQAGIEYVVSELEKQILKKSK